MTTKSNKNESLTNLEYAKELINNNQIENARKIILDLAQNEMYDADLLIKIGIAATQIEENICALNVFGRATKLQPENANYLNHHAQALERNGYLPQAMALYHEAIRIKPELLEPYIHLASMQMHAGDYNNVIKLMEKALTIKPSEPSIYPALAMSLCVIGRQEEALNYAKKLLKLEPNIPHSHHLLGRVYLELGQIDNAIKSLEKAIEVDPTFGESYGELLHTKKFTQDDYKLVNKAEKTLTTPLSPQARRSIHFFLGKAYDDLKEWNKAFEHFRKGNLQRRPAHDPVPDYKGFEKIQKLYNPQMFKKYRHVGHETSQPVFVIGMPRSGTTLIEQIISAHPKGDGAGELQTIHDIETQLIRAKSHNEYYKKLINILNPETLKPQQEYYLDILRRNRETAERIVDKMPDNFFYAGLIHLMFPNARIIHAIRNPLDTCLSCFFQQFTYIQWSYDLEWIAKRYRYYRHAMDHWQKVLPSGTMINVEYEELTQDPEFHSHRIIEHIGLPWDDRCLDFHQHQRKIRTASIWQARQPIYTSSYKRWTNYAPYIKGLAEDLFDFLPDEDIAEFEKQGIQLKKKRLFGWW